MGGSDFNTYFPKKSRSKKILQFSFHLIKKIKYKKKVKRSVLILDEILAIDCMLRCPT